MGHALMIKVNQGGAGLDSQDSRQEKAGFWAVKARLCKAVQIKAVKARQGKTGQARQDRLLQVLAPKTRQSKAGQAYSGKTRRVWFWEVKARLCRAEQIKVGEANEVGFWAVKASLRRAEQI